MTNYIKLSLWVVCRNFERNVFKKFKIQYHLLELMGKLEVIYIFIVCLRKKLLFNSKFELPKKHCLHNMSQEKKKGLKQRDFHGVVIKLVFGTQVTVFFS